MMKVVDLIKRLEELGYNEDTTICFGFYNYGEWCDFQVEEIEDEDRQCNVDTIGVILEPNKEYDKFILAESNIELEEDLRMLIRKYC
jgi:hypothetical protein